MYDTIVIGAGQAGLAIGYFLKNANKNFLLIDKGTEVGANWKNRYDSLVLFTPRIYSSLPGLPLSGEKHAFPSKDEIASYLKEYVQRFNLPIHLNEEVKKVSKVDNSFIIKTNRDVYHAKKVIVATGPFQTPNIPLFSKELSPRINQIHSSQYKNPNQLLNGNVIVVGGGNSGAQIAVELSKKMVTYLAVSKNLSYLPLVICNRNIFWWLDMLGILKASNHSLLGRAIQKRGDPVFGLELKQAINQNKVKVKTRVINANKNQLVFEDNSTLEVNNIIWATGFKTAFPWLQIDGFLDKEGKIIHNRGVSNIEGLYFIGLSWQSRRGSALLQGVGYDAEYIVDKISE
ncbi:SidA/IucD/PvdA family monooxygenase [Gracilibacillus salitolerans]|uniref:SidA/IucD/PvdA family monooxygenase n=1 Tax=Gracilibacillus salitolerans TaxID=2663022 RepID=A0A5Q2TQ85_9BACI|nr:NAD(P)-binding domain-containing protein [Gracilibacillus salitolerans]QGH35880.1 SidA/IucD/PvdA family monooxygenase [Gracilibacillus salitolerans]